jgi:hypothetical protein
MSERLVERLEQPEAFLSRSDLRELGLERRAVDAVFRACPVVVLPGYSRPLVRVEHYRALIEASTFRGDRVVRGRMIGQDNRMARQRDNAPGPATGG